MNLIGEDALYDLPDDADDDEHDGEGDGGGRVGLDQPQTGQAQQLDRNMAECEQYDGMRAIW